MGIEDNFMWPVDDRPEEGEYDKMRESVVLISGGQDSVTTLLVAMKETIVRFLIFVDYGQRHKVEKEMVDMWAQKFSIPILEVPFDFLSQVPSGLTEPSADIEGSHPIFPNLPVSFVPGRNLFFYLIAGTIARLNGIDIVYTGVCETDYSGYPDCRKNVVSAMTHTIREGLDSSNFIIKTPLMYLSKAQTFKLADDLGYLQDIIEDTHTCYVGDRTKRHDWGYGCGSCPACKIRANGYKEFLELK